MALLSSEVKRHEYKAKKLEERSNELQGQVDHYVTELNEADHRIVDLEKVFK